MKAYLQIGIVILDNNLDFNLCIVSTVCWMVVILDYKILEKSKILEDSQLDLCQILVRRVRDNIRVVNFFLKNQQFIIQNVMIDYGNYII